MKKTFTLICAVMMTCLVYSETFTLWEGEKTMDSSWPGISISVSDINNNSPKANDRLIVTVSKADNSINPDWQWGPQVFIKLDWQDFLTAKSVADGATNQEIAFDLTAENIEKMATANEINIQGMNVVVVKCVLEINNSSTSSSSIWEGECNFGSWANGFKIDAAKFGDASEGDRVQFVYTTTKNESEDWYQFKTIFDGTDETLSSNSSDLNDYGCASVAYGTTSYSIKLNAADIEKLKTTGMYINGKDIVVTQVNLIKVSTAIKSVKLENQDESYYNLNGIRVTSPKKGVFIHNGKKVVLK